MRILLSTLALIGSAMLSTLNASAMPVRQYTFRAEPYYTAKCAAAKISGTFTFTKDTKTNLWFADFSGGKRVLFFFDQGNTYRFSLQGSTNLTAMIDFDSRNFSYGYSKGRVSESCHGTFR